MIMRTDRPGGSEKQQAQDDPGSRNDQSAHGSILDGDAVRRPAAFNPDLVMIRARDHEDEDRRRAPSESRGGGARRRPLDPLTVEGATQPRPDLQRLERGAAPSGQPSLAEPGPAGADAVYGPVEANWLYAKYGSTSVTPIRVTTAAAT
jgi:hypothetical protein